MYTHINLSDLLENGRNSFDCALDPDGIAKEIYSTLFFGFLILTFAIVNYRICVCVRVPKKKRFMVITKVRWMFVRCTCIRAIDLSGEVVPF